MWQYTRIPYPVPIPPIKRCISFKNSPYPPPLHPGHRLFPSAKNLSFHITYSAALSRDRLKLNFTCCRIRKSWKRPVSYAMAVQSPREWLRTISYRTIRSPTPSPILFGITQQRFSATIKYQTTKVVNTSAHSAPKVVSTKMALQGIYFSSPKLEMQYNAGKNRLTVCVSFLSS